MTTRSEAIRTLDKILERGDTVVTHLIGGMALGGGLGALGGGAGVAAGAAIGGVLGVAIPEILSKFDRSKGMPGK